MEALEAQRLQKEMHSFCSYKLRTFLSFDDVDEITKQILAQSDEDIRNFIRVHQTIYFSLFLNHNNNKKQKGIY